jgi:hypothetical protein
MSEISAAISYGARWGAPHIVDETLEAVENTTIAPGDVVGIGIHTGNALRGYKIGRQLRDRGNAAARVNSKSRSGCTGRRRGADERQDVSAMEHLIGHPTVSSPGQSMAATSSVNATRRSVLPGVD